MYAYIEMLCVGALVALYNFTEVPYIDWTLVAAMSILVAVRVMVSAYLSRTRVGLHVDPTQVLFKAPDVMMTCLFYGLVAPYTGAPIWLPILVASSLVLVFIILLRHLKRIIDAANDNAEDGGEKQDAA